MKILSRNYKIFLIEDNPGDVRLIEESFRELSSNFDFFSQKDGEAAIHYLETQLQEKKEFPDLILLDLNLPRKNGFEVLKVIKNTEELKKIPVIVLSTSESEEDISMAYHLHANCYINKPLDFDDFNKIIESIDLFWLKTVKLPER